jgi:hypothetical protein
VTPQIFVAICFASKLWFAIRENLATPSCGQCTGEQNAFGLTMGAGQQDFFRGWNTKNHPSLHLTLITSHLNQLHEQTLLMIIKLHYIAITSRAPMKLLKCNSIAQSPAQVGKKLT